MERETNNSKALVPVQTASALSSSSSGGTETAVREKYPEVIHTITTLKASGSSSNVIELAKKKQEEQKGVIMLTPISEKGMITDARGKRLSVGLTLPEGINIKVEFDESDPKQVAKLHKQMARDLLQIVFQDEKPHKRYKHVRPQLEKVLQEQHESPRNAKIHEELQTLKKVSAVQISSRTTAKIEKETRSASSETVLPVQVASAPSPTARQLYLQNSPHKADGTTTETAYAELKDLLMKELADAGVSQKNQKNIYQMLTIAGPVVTATLTWLITHYTSHS